MTVRMLKRQLIKYALMTFASSGLARLIEPLTGGRGAILMLHRVKPRGPRAFQPNDHLEVTPEFLDEVLYRLRGMGVDLISMDEVPERLAARASARFVAVTLDDASLDNLTYGLDVFERNNCPFTVFATSGFLDRTALPWWMILEEVIAGHAVVNARSVGGSEAEIVGSLQQKNEAFKRLSVQFQSGPEETKQQKILDLAADNDLETDAFMDENFMDWDQLEELADSPLATIGTHTESHPMLARLSARQVFQEIQSGAERLEEELGSYPCHLAYPYGYKTAADADTFSQANALGFATAVTTRGGMLKGGGRDNLVALPRLSVNGHFQDFRVLRALLSGAPFFAAPADI